MKLMKDLMTQRIKLADVYPGKAKELGLDGDAVFVRKFFSAKDVSFDEGDDAIIGIISTASKDRDNEVLDPGGADLTDYNKNRTVLWAHEYGKLPLGTNMWIKVKKGVGLVAKTVFAPKPKEYRGDWFPDTVKHMMKTGHLRAFSVGFVPLEVEEPEDSSGESALTKIRRVYKKWLLLEYSVVPVPSNPDAVMAMIKSGEMTDLKMVEDLGVSAKAIGKPAAKKEERVKSIYLERSGEPGDGDRTLKLEGGVQLVYGKNAAGEPEVRGLVFDGKLYDEKQAQAWWDSHLYLADIVGDAAIKGEDGLPPTEALFDLYTRTMALVHKGGLAAASGVGKPDVDNEPPAPVEGEGDGDPAPEDGPEDEAGTAPANEPPAEDETPAGGGSDDEEDDTPEGDGGGPQADGDGGEAVGDDGDGSGDGAGGADGEDTEDGGQPGEAEGGDDSGEDNEAGGEAGPEDEPGQSQDADTPAAEDDAPEPDPAAAPDGNATPDGGEGGEAEPPVVTPPADEPNDEPEFDEDGNELFEIVTETGQPVGTKDLAAALKDILTSGAMGDTPRDTFTKSLSEVFQSLAPGSVAEINKKALDAPALGGTIDKNDPVFSDPEAALKWLTETDDGKDFVADLWRKEAGRVT